MKKRLITFALVIAMMATMIPSAFAATLPADVSDSWCKEYVADLIDKGVVNGYPDGTYRPNTNLSRGAIAKMAFMSMKAAGSSLKESTENNPFADTKGDWAEGYIAVLANTGNILPSEFGYKYEANKDMSRLDTAKLLVRIYQYAHPNEKLAGTATLNFTDASEISAADAPLVAKAVELGIITGYEDGSFKPSASINRATAAAMVSRFLKTVGNISDPAEFAVSTGGNGQISTDTTGAPVIQNVEWVIKPSIKIDYQGYATGTIFSSFSIDGISSYRLSDEDRNPTFVDIKGKTYQFKDTYVESITGFKHGYAAAQKISTGKWGFIDVSGKWGVEPKYDKADAFQTICYNDGTSITVCSVELNGETIVYDLSFNVVKGVPERIPEINWPATDKANGDRPYAEIMMEGQNIGDWGTMDGLFKYSISSPGNFPSTYGICDANGKIYVRATPMTSYYGGDPLHGSYDTADVKDDCIVMEHVVSVRWDVVSDFYDGKTGKLLYTCANTKEAAEMYGIPYQRFSQSSYGQGLFMIENDDHGRGYMNKYGDVVIPAVFDDVESFSNGYAWVKYNGLWGVIKLPNF